MFTRAKSEVDVSRIAARLWAGIPSTAFTAAVIFALSLVAPITIDIDSGMFTSKFAEAGGGDDQGDDDGGGGNDQGDNDGGGNNGGGNNGGGDNGGGDDQGDNDQGDNDGGDTDSGDTGNDSSAGNNGSSGTSTSNSTANGGSGANTGENGRLLITQPTVSLAQFTTRISKRYPADEIAVLDDPHQSISFFSELKDMSGQTITHLWFYEGELEFKASFKIRAVRWRIWSTQLLPENMPGEWTVEIVNEEDEIMEARTLKFTPNAPVLAEN